MGARERAWTGSLSFIFLSRGGFLFLPVRATRKACIGCCTGGSLTEIYDKLLDNELALCVHHTDSHREGVLDASECLRDDFSLIREGTKGISKFYKVFRDLRDRV